LNTFLPKSTFAFIAANCFLPTAGSSPLWHCFYSAIHLKRKAMAENNNRSQAAQGSEQNSRHDSSIGNQQGTTQTGAQNAGGENIDQEEDQYSEDLRNSGDRNSSNRKEGS
jgi:hypothetical protein